MHDTGSIRFGRIFLIYRPVGDEDRSVLGELIFNHSTHILSTYCVPGAGLMLGRKDVQV